MRKIPRTTLILSAAAAFAAAGLIPVLASAQQAAPPATPARPRMERPRPPADLNLTPDQVKALEAFRKARAEENRTFRDEMAKLGDEMRELRQDPQANQAKIDTLIDKRAGLMASHEKAAIRARIDRDKIFTPEQREKLKAMRSRWAARGARGRGWMRPGRGGRFFGPGAGFRGAARWRAFRDRAFFDWWF
jgi:Spy/CpxP family protein refolding chaperone